MAFTTTIEISYKRMITKPLFKWLLICQNFYQG